jgi:hypothetical protein
VNYSEKMLAQLLEHFRRIDGDVDCVLSCAQKEALAECDLVSVAERDGLLARVAACRPSADLAPVPLTPVEQEYLAGRLRLYTPTQFRRMSRVRALFQPLTRARQSGARRRVRTASSSAHGPPGRSTDDDPHERPSRVARLLRALCGLRRNR